MAGSVTVSMAHLKFTRTAGSDPGRATVIAAIGACLLLVLADRAALGVGFVDIRTVSPVVDVRALALDRRGFLWTAGERGVCRYDGDQWLCPDERPARGLFIDAADTIWAGLDDGALTEIRSFRFEVHPAGKATGTIRALVRVGHTLWIASSTGLHSRAVGDAGGGAARTVLTGSAAALAVRGDGTLVAALERSLYEVSASGQPRLWRTFGAPVSALDKVQDAPGDVWVATTDAAFRVGSGKDQKLALPDAENTLFAVSGDREGGVWVGGRDQLIHVRNGGGKPEVFGIENGLPHQDVRAVLVDGERDGWVGTPAGVARLRTRYPVRTLGRGDRLGTDLIFAVTGDQDGRIWASTAQGIAVWQGDWSKAYGLRQGFAVLDIRTVAIDAVGSVWAGGFKSGLFSLAGDRAIRRWVGQDGPDEGVRALRPRSAGGLWMGMHAGGLGSFVQGGFKQEFAPRARGRDRIFDILELGLDQGLLLALGGDGLAVFSRGELRRFDTADGLPEAEILCLLRDTVGAIWIGSNGGGLLRLRDGKLASVTTRAGLPDNRVFGLIEDKRGGIWMSSPLGVAALDRAQLAAAADGATGALEATLYGPAEGVPGEPVRAYPPSAYRSADGRLWFPSLRGLVNVDPEATPPGGPAPTAVFDDIQINGQSIVGGRSAGPATQTAELLFRFATPAFRSPRPLRVRYRLDGLDDGWHEGQRTREVRYQRVAPGSYTFRVQTSFADRRNPSERGETSFALRVRPRWRDTLLFRLSAAGLVLLSLGLVHRSRLRRIERTHAVVLSERSRIARDIHDSLEQDLSGLRMQIESAALTLDESPGRAREHLQRAAELIMDGVVDLRNSIWGLRSASDVNSAELITALRARLDRLTSGTGVAVQVLARGVSIRLPAALAGEIVHVGREAVTNALKHAAARTIAVTLDTTFEGSVCLLVADDGQGLSASAAPPRFAGGMGLPGMQARAHAIGGTVTVESSAETGTLVTLRVPIKRAKLSGQDAG